MIRLAITGSIGSGKSVAASIFRALGVPVYDSDSRAKELMVGALRPSIEALLGSDAYCGGSLNRAWIAARIFGDGVLKESLEAIVHPAVGDDFERWAAEQNLPLVALESAILMETPLKSAVGLILVVDAPLTLRIERIVRRDNCSPEQAINRAKAQMEPALLANFADFVIINDENELLVPKVVAIYEKLTNFARL